MLKLLAFRALLRLRPIIQTSLLGSYMRKSTRSTRRVNIGAQEFETLLACSNQLLSRMGMSKWDLSLDSSQYIDRYRLTYS